MLILMIEVLGRAGENQKQPGPGLRNGSAKLRSASLHDLYIYIERDR